MISDTGFGTVMVSQVVRPGNPCQHRFSTVEHFTQISDVYNDVRTTDIEPIRFVQEQLGDLCEITGADIGIGAGRYSYLLLREIKGLRLTCIDHNHAMLRRAGCLLRRLGDREFKLVRADSGGIPFADGAFDCMLAFNSIHHFDLSSFLREAERLLKCRGLLFIYTRLRAQNEKTIWGQYFPDFTAVERRLYDLGQLREFVTGTNSLEIDSIEYFSYARKAPLERLVAQAKAHHYSTFSLYQNGHFERALEQFQHNIRYAFPNDNRIRWTDENAMIVVRKTMLSPA